METVDIRGSRQEGETELRFGVFGLIPENRIPKKREDGFLALYFTGRRLTYG